MNRFAEFVEQQRLAQLRRLRRRALKCQPLRYSPSRRETRLKRCFAQNPRLGSVPRATTQRRRICASRCCRDTTSHEVFFLSPTLSESVSAQALGGDGLPSGRRPRNGATPGLLAKKRFSLFLRRRCEYRSGRHFSARRPGRPAPPNACAPRDRHLGASALSTSSSLISGDSASESARIRDFLQRHCAAYGASRRLFALR